MFKIVDIEDFSLFLATDEMRQEIEPRNIEAMEQNRAFLAANPPAQPHLPITGTFIYAHSPNYYGRPLHNYSIAAWTDLLNELKMLGMDSIILQAAIWHELDECYYPSKIFNYRKQWNVIDKLLTAAETTGLHVYLGGYGSAAGWRNNLTETMIRQEKERHRNCLQELMQLYSGRFDGFYFASETAYTGQRNRRKEQLLNDIYRDFCNTIKEHSIELKIIMSPATKYFKNKMAEMTDSWLTIMQDVPLDIMAPQDSIGTCGNLLCHQQETYAIWHQICQQLNIHFWSNIEIFERKPSIAGTDYNLPATINRVTAQINHAAPYAEKLICWEAPYYVSESVGKRGRILRKFLSQLNNSL